MRRKEYTLGNKDVLDFKIDFKSTRNCTTQLNHAVKGNSKLLKVRIVLDSINQLSTDTDTPNYLLVYVTN